MCAFLRCLTLFVGLAVGSLHDDEPMQTDELPIVRGDAPRRMFTPRWTELQQTYGIERPLRFPSEIFIHRMPPEYGIFQYATVGQSCGHT